jgi:uncharacterized protein
MVPMVISGVYTSAKSAYPQVVLKQMDGSAYLPIVIGRFEAAAISMAQADRQPARPISYDLAHSILKCIGVGLVRVEITGLHEGTYYAGVHVRDTDGTVQVIDSRPSDAIALALRMQAPIFASPLVLKEAGYVRPDGDDAQEVDAEPEGSVDAAPSEASIPVSGGTNGQAPPEQRVVELDPVDALRRRLEQAVAEEVYEEAARLRDEIVRLGRDTEG